MSDNRKKFHEAKYGKRSNRDEDSGDRFRARDQYKEKGLSEQKRDGTKGERERDAIDRTPWRGRCLLDSHRFFFQSL